MGRLFATLTPTHDLPYPLPAWVTPTHAIPYSRPVKKGKGKEKGKARRKSKHSKSRNRLESSDEEDEEDEAGAQASKRASLLHRAAFTTLTVSQGASASACRSHPPFIVVPPRISQRTSPVPARVSGSRAYCTVNIPIARRVCSFDTPQKFLYACNRSHTHSTDQLHIYCATA